MRIFRHFRFFNKILSPADLLPVFLNSASIADFLAFSCFYTKGFVASFSIRQINMNTARVVIASSKFLSKIFDIC